MLSTIDLTPAPATRRRDLLNAIPVTPRRLVHVFPNFNVGGAQVRFAALVEGLGERFHHTVLSLNGSYEAAALLPRGAQVCLGGAPPRAGALPAQLRTYRAYLADLQADLLLTYNWGAIEMALANVLGGIPHVHMEDGFGPDETTRQIPRRVWTRRVALARSQVVVPSITLQDIATRNWRLDPRSVHYIPNGIAPKLHSSTPIESLGLDLPAGLPRIVWVGALRPEKNPIRLLRAFAPIKDEAVLLVMGEGLEREALLGEAERLGLGSSLRLLGRRSDARDIIMQCQVLALSSDTEQMPLVVLEAMDAGLPVASSDVGDVRRMVAMENRPFVTPPSAEALAGALRTLVADANLRTAIGQANRKRLRAVYTLPPMVEAYGALFDRMAVHSRMRRAHA